jgi:hypothetical protein
MKCKYCKCSLQRDRAGVLHDTDIKFLSSVCARSPERPLPVHVVTGGYTLGDVVDDLPADFAREILDPQGVVIAYVVGDRKEAVTLLSHLNK